MARAGQTSTVMVHYDIRLDDGSLVHSSSEGPPLTVKLGEGKMFASVEQALVGLAAGEGVTVRVSAEEAFAPHAPDVVMVVDRESLPSDVVPEVGMMLGTRLPDDSVLRLLVTDVGPSGETLDGNHPLAGQPLNVEVQVPALVWS